MASYTVGNATWSITTTHKVVFSYLTSRPAVFLNTHWFYVSGSYPITKTSAISGTTQDFIDGPGRSYESKLQYCGNYNVTGSTVSELKYVGTPSYYDSSYGYGITNGSQLNILINTTGNTGGWVAKLRKTVGSDTGAISVNLPATTDATWVELALPISAYTGLFSELVIHPASGYFSTGDKCCVGSCYITTSDTKSIELTDTISPDGGTNNYTVIGVYNDANVNGTLYTVYTSEAYSGSQGSYSTTRTEQTNTNKDLTSTTTTTSTCSATIGFAKPLGTTISVNSTTSLATISWVVPYDTVVSVNSTSGAGQVDVDRPLTSTLTNTAGVDGYVNKDTPLNPSTIQTTSIVDAVLLRIRQMSSTIASSVSISSITTSVTNIATLIFGRSVVDTVLNKVVSLTSTTTSTAEVSSAFTGTTGSYSLGNATWVSGSKFVTFNQPNYNVVTLNDFYPFTYPLSGGGLSPAGIWGTTSGAPDYSSARKTTDLNYTCVRAIPDVTLKLNQFGMQVRKYPITGTHFSTVGKTVLNVVLRVNQTNADVKNNISVAVSDIDQNEVDPTYGVSIGTFANTPTPSFLTCVLDIPNNPTIFKELYVFHTLDNTFFKEEALVDNAYLTNKSSQAILLTDNMSPDGGTTTYRIQKLMQKSTGEVVLILDRAFVGTTGTYDTTRFVAQPYQTTINSVSAVGVGFLTKLRQLISTIANQASVLTTIGKTVAVRSTIQNLSSVGSFITRLQQMAVSIISSSTLSSTASTLTGFISQLVVNSVVSANEYIRYKFNSAVVNAQNTTTGTLGKLRVYIGHISNQSHLSSVFSHLPFYYAQVAIATQSTVNGLIGYTKYFGQTLFVAVSSTVIGYINAVRGINTTIAPTSTVSAFFVRNAVVQTTIPVVSSTTINHKFLLGLFPSTISSTGVVSANQLDRAAGLTSLFNAVSAVIQSGEFRPVKLVSATIDAAGVITCALNNQLATSTATINAVNAINGLLNKDNALTCTLTSDSNGIAWLDVPEPLRHLLITSSGVIITGLEGVVSFQDVATTHKLTIKGLTVVELNNGGNTQTIIVVD